MDDLTNGTTMWKLAAGHNERPTTTALDLLKSWGAAHHRELVVPGRGRRRLAPIAHRKSIAPPPEVSFLVKKKVDEARARAKRRARVRRGQLLAVAALAARCERLRAALRLSRAVRRLVVRWRDRRFRRLSGTWLWASRAVRARRAAGLVSRFLSDAKRVAGGVPAHRAIRKVIRSARICQKYWNRWRVRRLARLETLRRVWDRVVNRKGGDLHDFGRALTLVGLPVAATWIMRKRDAFEARKARLLEALPPAEVDANFILGGDPLNSDCRRALDGAGNG